MWGLESFPRSGAHNWPMTSLLLGMRQPRLASPPDPVQATSLPSHFLPCGSWASTLSLCFLVASPAPGTRACTAPSPPGSVLTLGSHCCPPCTPSSGPVQGQFSQHGPSRWLQASSLTCLDIIWAWQVLNSGLSWVLVLAPTVTHQKLRWREAPGGGATAGGWQENTELVAEALGSSPAWHWCAV